MQGLPSRVLDGQIRRGMGETIHAVIYLCDLRGFTSLSEALPREALIDMLNSYFGPICDAVAEHHGEILKFIGDAMLAIFPVDTDAMVTLNPITAMVLGIVVGREADGGTDRRHGPRPHRYLGWQQCLLQPRKVGMSRRFRFGQMAERPFLMSGWGVIRDGSAMSAKVRSRNPLSILFYGVTYDDMPKVGYLSHRASP
jgi:hypothetical protein